MCVMWSVYCHNVILVASLHSSPSESHLWYSYLCLIPFHIYQNRTVSPIGYGANDDVSLPSLDDERLRFYLNCFHTLSLWTLTLGEAISWTALWRGAEGEELKPPTNSHINELGSGSSNPSQVFREQNTNVTATSEKTWARSTQLSHSLVPDLRNILES